MDSLPYDLIVKIALEIHPIHLINLALISRKFRRLGNDEILFRKYLHKIFLEFKSDLPHWEFEPFPTFKETFIRLYKMKKYISFEIHRAYGLEYKHYNKSDSAWKSDYEYSLEMVYKSNNGRLKYSKSEKFHKYHITETEVGKYQIPLLFLHEGVCFLDGDRYRLFYPESHITLLFNKMENKIYERQQKKIELAKNFLESSPNLIYKVSNPGAFFSKLSPYLTLLGAEFSLLDLQIINKPLNRDNHHINFKVSRIPRFSNWKMAQEDELDTLNEEKEARQHKRHCSFKIELKHRTVYLKDLFDYYDRMKDNYPERIEIGMKFYGKNGLKDDSIILALEKIDI